jgi:hypothetical protein
MRPGAGKRRGDDSQVKIAKEIDIWRCNGFTYLVFLSAFK